MNILFLTYAVPSLIDCGPKTKTACLLRYLAARHHVTLVSFTHTAHDDAQLTALRLLCTAVYSVPTRAENLRSASMTVDMWSGRPRTQRRGASIAMHNLLSHLVISATHAGQPFDLVHVDQLRMAPYAEPLPIPRLLDTHDVHYRTYEARESQQYGVQRWWAHRESAMLRRYEGRICASFEAVTTISDEDRQALLDVMPYPHVCEVTTIPMAVDGESLTPIPRDPASQTIASIVAPSWVPHGSGISWFAHEVYPLVCRAAPNSQVLICGAQSIPAGYAERGLAQQHPHIHYVDHADPAEQSARAACLIAPLQHSGMRIMILEALARAIPVVATHAAIAGLNLRAGEHLLVADTPSDFADAVVMLLREPDLGQRIAAAGRQVVLEHYNWRVASRVFDAVYERMVAASRLDDTLSKRTGAITQANGFHRIR